MQPPFSDPRATATHVYKPCTSAVLLFLLFMLALWTLLMGLSHQAPDMDGMEELVWASSLEWGYAKHPPFPTWIMHGLTQVFGRPIWLTFFAGMLVSVAGLWFIWKLGREFLPPQQAFMVVLLGSVSIYFSLRGTIFNHNTAQFWSITASIWLFYRACRYERLVDWALLGVVAGFALMSKYSAVIQFAAFFLYLLASGLWRKASIWRGALLALVLLGLTISPHLYWLHEHDYAPFQYMDESLATEGRWAAYAALFSFSLDQIARLSPMLVAVGVWAYWYRRSPDQDQPQACYAQQLRPEDKQFLKWVGLSPILSTLLVSAILGTHLDASWATTFFVLYSFYFLYILKGTPQVQLKRILAIVIVLHILMALGYAIARGPLAWENGRKSRSTFPGPAISAQMQAIWQEHVPSHPLWLIASDTWLGGNIAVHLGRDAQVYTDGKPEFSPWLNMPQDAACGMLVVYSLASKSEPDQTLLDLHAQGRYSGVAYQRWSSERSPNIDLNWAIIPPGPACPSP